MGAMIVEQRVPAFIITLGGLLVFRGLHWLVIHNQTVPVVGRQRQPLLAAHHLLPAAGGRATSLAALAIVRSWSWSSQLARAHVARRSASTVGRRRDARS